MRKYLIAIACLFAVQAQAADYPTKPYGTNYAPQAFTWTGNWIGIQGSYAFQGSLDNPFVGFDVDGYSFGGNIGTQRQYGAIIVGLELEANYAKIEGNSNIGPIAINHSTDAYGSLRARLGTVVGQAHVYGLGGIALASTEATLSVPGFSTSASNLHWGWVAGAGIEYAVAPNWVVGAEAAYYRFRSEDYGFAIAGPIGLVTPAEFDFWNVKGKAAYRW